ncbi:MAG: hypothetical protein JWL72_2869 [Ilumatobacteraceae bacterium]|nr:hypothetical protein [Ilumatobacteraceae bacterium]
MTSTLFPSSSFRSTSFRSTPLHSTEVVLHPLALRPLALRPISVRMVNVRPHHSVYVRRRLVVGLVIVGMLAVIGLASRSVLADRGGVPASTPTVRLATPLPASLIPASLIAAAAPRAVAATDPAAGAATAPPALASPALQVGTPPPAAAGSTLYLVQPGDTLWSLAQLFHGTQSVSSYVDSMVDRNGGAALQVGQVLTLP